MSDLISRADAVNAVHKYFVAKINNEPHEIDEDGDDVFTDMKSVNALFHHNKMVSKAIKALPSADAVDVNDVTIHYKPYPSTDAVHIHNDGTLEVKVPNAQKVGRVLVMDTDSHIGGGLFYPADAIQGEWKQTITWQPYCSNCEYVFGEDEEFSPFWNYCPMCGARMKGGAE